VELFVVEESVPQEVPDVEAIGRTHQTPHHEHLERRDHHHQPPATSNDDDDDCAETGEGEEEEEEREYGIGTQEVLERGLPEEVVDAARHPLPPLRLPAHWW
jgi:hypothetical protein